MLSTPPATPPLSILMYHQIGLYPRPKAHRALFCHIGRFRQQLAYLKYTGFRVLSLEEARQCLFEGRPLPQRSVVITVDDGFDDFREHAWPALQEYGFPATVFLVSSLIGKNAAWLQDRPQQSRLMDAASIRRLHQEGCHFGSHAMSHPRLTQLTAAQQRQEIFGSKQALEDLLGAEVPDFCYPYGDYNAQVRDLVQEAGYRTGLTCIRGAANTAHNPFELPRKAISYGDNLIGYAWKLHMKHKRKDGQ
ncbi:MAG: polysaccharide deacetylase family protein [Aquabacterium sp.]|uniref:polysaccharide deacetylase family protein n=1 Tax=Aquabacterium sp. TaxID=1872578 RepID=UPI003BCE9F8C